MRVFSFPIKKMFSANLSTHVLDPLTLTIENMTTLAVLSANYSFLYE